MKKLLYWLEALLLRSMCLFFRALPLDVGSAVGGFIGRNFGPFVSAHKIALDNLRHAFPEKSEIERVKIARGMWDNLGRVIAEFPNLPGKKLTSRLTVHGAENLPKPGESVLFFSGHIGNWELTYPMAFDRGVPTTLIYRHANNPYVDRLVMQLRLSHASKLFPKGIRGAVKIVRAIKDNESLAMLVDQKLNTGISAAFFGREAMTAPAIAELALRYDKPIVPVRVIRKKGAHFEGHIYTPLAFTRSGNDEKDTHDIMLQINALLESWIREYPEQWFWVHKRWPN